LFRIRDRVSAPFSDLLASCGFLVKGILPEEPVTTTTGLETVDALLQHGRELADHLRESARELQTCVNHSRTLIATAEGVLLDAARLTREFPSRLEDRAS
jgi:hypothetical protein